MQLPDHQQLVKLYRKVKNCMSPEDRKEAQQYFAYIDSGRADVADYHDFYQLLKQYYYDYSEGPC
jgi:hypothetical protein